MRKFLLWMALVGSVAFLLSACAERKIHYTLDVLDAHDQKICTVTDEETLAYFADLVEKSADDPGEGDVLEAVHGLPEDAQVARHFVFTGEEQGRKAKSISFYTYANYPYLTMKDVPVVGSVTWKISEEKAQQLREIGAQ